LDNKKLQFLAVTEDPTISQALEDLDPSTGWNLVVFSDPARVFSSALDEFHLLVLDEAVTGSSYLAIVRRARKRSPMVDITVVGGPKSDEVRFSDKKHGVDCYLERPMDSGGLKAALEHRRAIAELKAFAGIVGRSPQMEDILEAILQVGPTEVSILIEGETGTGKDVVARGIHHASRRRDGPYVAINCASLAEGVLESELFGHEKGAFTGAVARRAGVFERADRGTIFLDEVGEMSANMQVRLLRVLESGEILRVGGVRSLRVDVRVIAATNRSLKQAVIDGKFRQDLYYRIKGVNFLLPALRDRKEDIEVLADYFVRESGRRHGKDVKGIDKDGLRRLSNYPWPGNIRELRNVIDTAVVLSSGARIGGDVIDSQLVEERPTEGTLLPVPLHRTKDEAEREMIYASILAMHRDVREVLEMMRHAMGGGHPEAFKEVFPNGPAQPENVQTLSSLERTAIQEALRTAGGNRRRTADILGISERTLYRKIKEYGLI